MSEERDNPYMRGRMIEPLRLEKGMSVSDFVDEVFSASGYNARRLGEACELYKRMIEEDTTICLTVAGAMTPIGMSGIIRDLIKNGFVDWIMSTGANLYHDLHRPYDFPMIQGDFRANDSELHSNGIARIYDVFIKDDETLTATDKEILNVVEKAREKFQEGVRISTADYHYELGKAVSENAASPEKSLMAAAAEYNVPIYTPAFSDSSLAFNLLFEYIFHNNLVGPRPTLDMLESTAIVWNAEKNGAVELGGGTPKNFYMQTQPILWQILELSKGGHDYFIQITTDAPHWGGLSGATPQEAKSWGKVKDAEINNVVVYSDSSIAFPILALYALEKCRPRKSKQLYSKKNSLVEKLCEEARQNKTLTDKLKRVNFLEK